MMVSDAAVRDYLHAHCRGAEAAHSVPMIARALECSVGEVRDAVRRLRHEGYGIGSSIGRHPGYYIPEDTRQALRSLQGLYSRAEGLHEVIAAQCNRNPSLGLAFKSWLAEQRHKEQVTGSQLTLAG